MIKALNKIGKDRVNAAELKREFVWHIGCSGVKRIEWPTMLLIYGLAALYLPLKPELGGLPFLSGNEGGVENKTLIRERPVEHRPRVVQPHCSEFIMIGLKKTVPYVGRESLRRHT